MTECLHPEGTQFLASVFKALMQTPHRINHGLPGNVQSIGFRIAAAAWCLVLLFAARTHAAEHAATPLDVRDVNTVFQSTGTRYVATDGTHLFPFDSRETAATNIQAAIDSAPPGGQVLVSHGVYTVSTAILVTNAITVRGVKGAAVTHVSGANATRVFVLGHRDAVIEGLTIRDGRIEGGGIFENNGGGVWFDPEGSGGTLQHCILIDNVAFDDGGGVYMAGKPYGTWVVRNCLMADNHAVEWGGGIFVRDYGIIQNCTIIGNSADWGGGIFIEKDPVDVTIENTLTWHNTAAADDDNYSFDGLPAVLHSSAPGFSAMGSRNIDEVPPFVNAGAGNYRLDGSQTNWPGFLGGVVRSWMLHAVDLDGNDRLGVVDGQLFVDMGAYQRAAGHETTAKGTPIAWFQSHAIAIDPDRGEENWNDVDARYNPDKQMTLRQEYLADTDPNDPTSLLRIVALKYVPQGLALTVSVRSQRLYTLEYSTGPAFTNWAPLPGYHDLQGIPDPLKVTNFFGAGSPELYRIRVRDVKD